MGNPVYTDTSTYHSFLWISPNYGAVAVVEGDSLINDSTVYLGVITLLYESNVGIGESNVISNSGLKIKPLTNPLGFPVKFNVNIPGNKIGEIINIFDVRRPFVYVVSYRHLGFLIRKRIESQLKKQLPTTLTPYGFFYIDLQRDEEGKPRFESTSMGATDTSHVVDNIPSP